MGLFYDHAHGLSNREGWKYTYIGADLLEPALKKYFNVEATEMEARNELAALLKNASVPMSDPRNEDLKKKIERLGKEKELLMVLCHEFRRSPSREFILGLADMTYFDLATAPVKPETTE